uniref:Uncharacterized protein n=1 Tax=Cucumis melo TaxID=3656 RepID=A0A9I9EIK4_CUCME
MGFAFTSISSTRPGIHFHQYLAIDLGFTFASVPQFNPRLDLRFTSPTSSFQVHNSFLLRLRIHFTSITRLDLGFSSPVSRVKYGISTGVLR